MRYLAILLAVISLATSTSVYNKVVLTNPEALCLDGTHGAYYITVGDPNRIMISFQGGGWCGGADLNSALQNCYQRSKTTLGSSSAYAATMSSSEGILSDNTLNYFKNWTKVHLKYCDGTGHQGYRKNSVSYKGQELYFRGHNLTIAQLDSIDASHKIFSQATQIVVTGQSAGGLATFSWVNYIRDRASKGASVWAIPDSGIFLDEVNIQTKVNSYRILFQNFMKYSNVEIDPPGSECVKAYANEKWKCLFAQYIHPFIKVPLFSIQSLYDSWSLPNILGVRCQNGLSFLPCNSTLRSIIEDYHQNMSRVLTAIGTKAQNGYWAPACSNHVYSTTTMFYSAQYRVPEKSEFSVVQTVTNWIESKPNNRHMDTGAWPSNAACAGQTAIQLQI